MEARQGRDVAGGAMRKHDSSAAACRDAGGSPQCRCVDARMGFALLRRSKLSRLTVNVTMFPCSTFMESEVEQSRQTSNADSTDTGQSLPQPGTEAYAALPQLLSCSPLPFRRTIRRGELRQIVPLAETTIYEMEQRGEFPRRFRLTARCVVWDLEEVEAWIEERKQASRAAKSAAPAAPDVRLRRYRPIR